MLLKSCETWVSTDVLYVSKGLIVMQLLCYQYRFIYRHETEGKWGGFGCIRERVVSGFYLLSYAQ